ncbi:MAG: hypothetical protein ACH34U_04325 [Cyanobium sp.]
MMISGYYRKSVLRVLSRKSIPADGDGALSESYRHHRCRYCPEVKGAVAAL